MYVTVATFCNFDNILKTPILLYNCIYMGGKIIPRSINLEKSLGIIMEKCIWFKVRLLILINVLINTHFDIGTFYDNKISVVPR